MEPVTQQQETVTKQKNPLRIEQGKKLVEYNKCKKEELKRLNEQITKQDNIAEHKPRPDTSAYVYAGSLSVLECYMDWFPSLICKNYIFKHFVKTVEPMSLKFCMIIELITLHLECIIAQVKYSNFSHAHAQTFVC